MVPETKVTEVVRAFVVFLASFNVSTKVKLFKISGPVLTTAIKKCTTSPTLIPEAPLSVIEAVFVTSIAGNCPI